MDSLLGSLTETELSLVREVEPDRLAGLDEDALIELHTRIRRARNKYVKVYRRRAAAEIADAGGRGKAHARNTRNRAKAEVFENLLARVSEQLAAAAHASAKELESERLSEAAHPVAPAQSYLVTLALAERSGITPQAVQAALAALAPVVGGPRVVSAATKVLQAVHMAGG